MKLLSLSTTEGQQSGSGAKQLRSLLGATVYQFNGSRVSRPYDVISYVKATRHSK
jgi:hypothetical protein